MSRTTRYGGKDWYGTWTYSGGTITLSGDQTVFTVTRGGQRSESTAGADGATNEIHLRQDNTFAITTRATTGGTVAWKDAFAPGVEGTLIYSTGGGTVAGSPKGTVVAMVTDSDVNEDHAATTDWNVSWRGQDTLAYTTW